MYACAFVRQIVTSNHFRILIRQDWKSVTLTLRQIAGLFRLINTNSYRTYPRFIQFAQASLDTPQLGVT